VSGPKLAAYFKLSNCYAPEARASHFCLPLMVDIPMRADCRIAPKGVSSLSLYCCPVISLLAVCSHLRVQLDQRKFASAAHAAQCPQLEDAQPPITPTGSACDVAGDFTSSVEMFRHSPSPIFAPSFAPKLMPKVAFWPKT
jgi:hypothetical protein